ncbi:MAG: hypothetical protein M1819_003477 [Sarea resinae]|nr:MAG: hypothetical protein M1819_003477 [Sarea resinae]
MDPKRQFYASASGSVMMGYACQGVSAHIGKAEVFSLWLRDSANRIRLICIQTPSPVYRWRLHDDWNCRPRIPPVFWYCFESYLLIFHSDTVDRANDYCAGNRAEPTDYIAYTLQFQPSLSKSSSINWSPQTRSRSTTGMPIHVKRRVAHLRQPLVPQRPGTVLRMIQIKGHVIKHGVSPEAPDRLFQEVRAVCQVKFLVGEDSSQAPLAHLIECDGMVKAPVGPEWILNVGQIRFHELRVETVGVQPGHEQNIEKTALCTGFFWAAPTVFPARRGCIAGAGQLRCRLGLSAVNVLKPVGKESLAEETRGKQNNDSE